MKWFVLPCLAFGALGAPAPAFSLGDVRSKLARLETLEPAQAQQELETLAHEGEDAALAALDGFADRSLAARRGRAWLVFEAGGAKCVAGALASLADVDASVREWLVRFAGRADLGAAELDVRAAALSERALSDRDVRVRGAALVALADLDQPASLDRLDRLVDDLEGPEQAFAIRLLSQKVRARTAVLRRVQAAFTGEVADVAASPGTNAQLSPEALSVLLPAYGRALAEVPSQAEGAQGRAPILLALRHPDPRVRRAADLAFDAWMRRAIAMGDAQRADRVLAGFAADGLDALLATYQRARLALIMSDDPHAALARARELAQLADDAGDGPLAIDGRAWHARALQLQALALIAAGEAREARAPLESEQRLLNGWMSERLDLCGDTRSAQHEDALHLSALCELTLAVRDLALADHAPRDPGAAPAPPALPAPPGGEAFSAEALAALLEHARAAHALELEAQVAAWRAGRDGDNTLDALLETDLSPWTTIFENPRLAKWPAARSLAVRATLGRLLSSVAKTEMPGFEAFDSLPREADGMGGIGEIRDPLADARRLALLKSLANARVDALHKEWDELYQRLARVAQDNPAGPEAGDEERLIRLQVEMNDALEVSSRGAENGWRGLLELRVPSASALSLARALRDDGQSEKARALATAMRADLERDGLADRYIFGLELRAEIEMVLGSSFTDEDEPRLAETELEKAVERLQSIEDLMRARGFFGRELGRVRLLRCSALVSLAVNANVKQSDAKKAIAYFERAWELRQDDFMRVLRACYRARAGRAEEARAILREVAPVPGTHYNMACTYALLGETDLAIDFLKREFEENQLSPGASEKQKEWARKDPDLKSLRDDPRFKDLVGS